MLRALAPVLSGGSSRGSPRVADPRTGALLARPPGGRWAWMGVASRPGGRESHKTDRPRCPYGSTGSLGPRFNQPVFKSRGQGGLVADGVPAPPFSESSSVGALDTTRGAEGGSQARAANAARWRGEGGERRTTSGRGGTTRQGCVAAESCSMDLAGVSSPGWTQNHMDPIVLEAAPFPRVLFRVQGSSTSVGAAATDATPTPVASAVPPIRRTSQPSPSGDEARPGLVEPTKGLVDLRGPVSGGLGEVVS
eukprot:gene19092-25693_t